MSNFSQDFIDIQQQANLQLGRSSLPTYGSENWKYTSLKDYLKTEFKAAPEKMYDFAVPAEVKSLISDFDTCLFFYNGNHVAKESFNRLTNGSLAIPLDEALSDFPETHPQIKNLLSKPPAESLQALGWRHRAQFKQGAYVRLKANRFTSEKPIKVAVICFYGNISSGEEEKPFSVFPQNIYSIDSHSAAEIFEAHFAVNNIRMQIHNSSRLFCSEGSKTSLAQVLWPGTEAVTFNDVSVDIEQEASLECFNLNIDSLMTRSELDISLMGINSRVENYCLSLLGEGAQIDFNSQIHHRTGSSQSKQIVKNVVGKKSKAVFSGRITIDEMAQKSDAYQKNYNLLLSDSAEAYTRPQLLVNADDVKAAHGATVGSLREEEIFYLQSRGISAEQARQLLASGFQTELVGRMKSKSLSQLLNYCLHAKETIV